MAALLSLALVAVIFYLVAKTLLVVLQTLGYSCKMVKDVVVACNKPIMGKPASERTDGALWVLVSNTAKLIVWLVPLVITALRWLFNELGRAITALGLYLYEVKQKFLIREMLARKKRND